MRKKLKKEQFENPTISNEKSIWKLQIDWWKTWYMFPPRYLHWVGSQESSANFNSNQSRHSMQKLPSYWDKSDETDIGENDLSIYDEIRD